MACYKLFQTIVKDLDGTPSSQFNEADLYALYIGSCFFNVILIFYLFHRDFQRFCLCHNCDLPSNNYYVTNRYLFRCISHRSPSILIQNLLLICAQHSKEITGWEYSSHRSLLKWASALVTSPTIKPTV